MHPCEGAMEATATKSPDMTGFSREAVEALSRSRNEPDWVREARLAAWETYESLPMPTRSDEEWRRTDLRRLKLDRFAPFGDQSRVSMVCFTWRRKAPA